MNIVLIGYRGTGKSEVARIVARRLGRAWVPMDTRIVETAGAPITEIVERHGWERFRDLESQLTAEIIQRDDQVIDTGGGVIERPQNIAWLRSNGYLVWLKATAATIVKRIQKDTGRPALTAGKTFTEEVSEVLTRREPQYRSAAHWEIDTDELTPAQVAEEIINRLRRLTAVPA